MEQNFIGNSELGYLGNAATGVSFPIISCSNGGLQVQHGQQSLKGKLYRNNQLSGKDVGCILPIDWKISPCCCCISCSRYCLFYAIGNYFVLLRINNSFRQLQPLLTIFNPLMTMFYLLIHSHTSMLVYRRQTMPSKRINM